MSNKFAVLGILMLVASLLTGCLEVDGGLNKSVSSVATTSSTQESSPTSEENTEAAPFGSTVSIGGVEFTPTKAHLTKTIGTTTTENQYLVLTVKAKNTSAKAVSITDGQFILVDRNGNQYKANSTDFIFDLDQYFSIVDDINPGLTKTGDVVFEVPSDLSEFMVAIRADMFDFGGADYKFVMLNID